MRVNTRNIRIVEVHAFCTFCAKPIVFVGMVAGTGDFLKELQRNSPSCPAHASLLDVRGWMFEDDWRGVLDATHNTEE